MDYSKLEKDLRKWVKEHPRESLTAHIVFTEDSCPKHSPRMSRSYSVSINSKTFWLGISGRSIVAHCLDGMGQKIKLNMRMLEESDPGGWKIEDCYILEQMQDAAAIPHFERKVQEDGTVCYFFGNTCIRVQETQENGTIHLEPLRGDQTVCGEWVDLSMDRVYGYTALLERHLNAGSVVTKDRHCRK